MALNETSITEVMTRVEKAHSHFFDKDTMRFFQSRASETCYIKGTDKLKMWALWQNIGEGLKMDRKLWNKLKPTQRLSILYVNNMAYYPYHNARCSWGKLTPHVQNLLSKIEVVL